jgi:glutathione S-transferase
VFDSFALIEREMFTGPWVMGDQYTIADPYLYTVATWWEGDSVDPAKLPKLAAHRKRMSERPAVQRVMSAQGVKLAA